MSQSEFTPTHIAPREGLQAWDAPDPSRPAVAQVQPGVRMQLMERRGAWARVLFSNGWSGWVDGRRMLDAAPRPAVAPSPSPVDRRDATEYAAYRPETQQPAERPEAQQPASRPEAQQAGAERPEAQQPAYRPDLHQPAYRPQAQYRPEPESRFRPEPESPYRPEPAFRPEPESPYRPEREPQFGTGAQAQSQSAFRPEPAPGSTAFRDEREPAYQPESGYRPEPAPEAAANQEAEPSPDATAPVPRPRPAAPQLANLLQRVKLSPAPIGALAVILGILLPWIRMSGFRGNAFRVPLTFLVDYKTTGGALKVGLAVLALAVAAGVFCVLPGQVRNRRILGGIIGVVAVIYVIQLQRVLSAAGTGAPSLASVVGFGVLVTLAGGIALMVDTTEPPSR